MNRLHGLVRFPTLALPKLALPKLTSRPLAVGGLILLTVVALAVLAQQLYPGDPLDIVGRPNLWPLSLIHI